MADSQDTVVAVASPPGRGAIGVVRVSGPGARHIGEQILGLVPAARHAALRPFLDDSGQALDQGLALFFPAPHSFTGDDVLELQGHGGPVVLDLIVQRACALGARLARPGEFSERAFLNDRIDLAQAEAIADLIDSATAEAARAATRSLQGVFSTRVSALVESLVELRVHIEAAIDFPEEEIDFLAEANIAQRLKGLSMNLRNVVAAAHQGQVLRDGLRVVIAGRPNVGKSSLLNCLAGRESAIVTEVPGTTRDVIRETIDIEGMPLHVLDTAGLRESDDPVEQEGIRRAWAEIETADRVLLVVDDDRGVGAEERRWLAQHASSAKVSIVRNKIDLSGAEPGLIEGEHGPEIRLSAAIGLGLDSLRGHLEQCAGYQSSGEGLFMARRRHLEALEHAQDALGRADRQWRQQRAGELVAEDLRRAQLALSEITGEFTTEDLLGRIFASFCIGK